MNDNANEEIVCLTYILEDHEFFRVWRNNRKIKRNNAWEAVGFATPEEGVISFIRILALGQMTPNLRGALNLLYESYRIFTKEKMEAS
jgi:hypothetical protein